MVLVGISFGSEENSEAHAILEYSLYVKLFNNIKEMHIAIYSMWTYSVCVVDVGTALKFFSDIFFIYWLAVLQLNDEWFLPNTKILVILLVCSITSTKSFFVSVCLSTLLYLYPIQSWSAYKQCLYWQYWRQDSNSLSW